jgi:hypothetical protein
MMKISEKEKYAILQVFKVLHKVGVTVDDAQEAEDAVDLAAIMLEQILETKVDRDELKLKMLSIMLNDIAVVH